MANKCVPQVIAGVELHPGAKERTHKLLLKLEERGAKGVAEEKLSMIDRFRLLASAFFTTTDTKTDAAAPVSDEPNND
jgi:hypothetical protein